MRTTKHTVNLDSSDMLLWPSYFLPQYLLWWHHVLLGRSRRQSGAFCSVRPPRLPQRCPSTCWWWTSETSRWRGARIGWGSTPAAPCRPSSCCQSEERENYKLRSEKTTNWGQRKLHIESRENYKPKTENYELRIGKTTNWGQGKLQIEDW